MSLKDRIPRNINHISCLVNSGAALHWLIDLDKEIEDSIDSILSMIRRPNLEWVEYFIDDILNDEYDHSYYLKKYNIDIHLEPIAKDCLFINHASYSPKEKVFRLYIREDIDDATVMDKIKFAQEIREFFVHEDTHMQQDQLESYKQHYYPDVFDVRHFTQYEEITPYARGIAYAIMIRKPEWDYDKIIEAVVKNDPDLKLFLPQKDIAILNAYQKVDDKTLKRFLKKMHEFFYYKDFNSGGKIELRQWLKEASNKPHDELLICNRQLCSNKCRKTAKCIKLYQNYKIYN